MYHMLYALCSMFRHANTSLLPQLPRVWDHNSVSNQVSVTMLIDDYGA
jgi:hypothetical protein